MNQIKLYALGLFTVASSTVACANHEPQTPAEARNEDTAEMAEKHADMRADHTEDQADLKADQRKQSAQTEADIEKARADAQADRVKVDAEITARLQKVDARLNELTPRIAKAKASVKTKATDLLKSAQEQRTALDRRRADLSKVTQDKWQETSTALDSGVKMLERNVDEIEDLVKS